MKPLHTSISRLPRLLLITLAVLTLSTASTVPSERAQSKTVYVCTGSYAKAYHGSRNCKGLGNCKGEVKAISKDEAVRIGRTPCKVCKP